MYSSVGGAETAKTLAAAAPGIATSTTASEQVLATYTIQPNTLAVNGATIRIYFFAHTAANSNNKRLLVRVGGVAGVIISDSTTSAQNNMNLTTYGPIMITRTGASTATVSGGIVHRGSDSSTTPPTTLAGWTVRASSINWAIANDLVFTGTTPTAIGDLILDSYTIELLTPPN